MKGKIAQRLALYFTLTHYFILFFPSIVGSRNSFFFFFFSEEVFILRLSFVLVPICEAQRGFKTALSSPPSGGTLK